MTYYRKVGYIHTRSIENADREEKRQRRKAINVDKATEKILKILDTKPN